MTGKRLIVGVEDDGVDMMPLAENKYKQTHMDMAYLIGRHSHCLKRKVGAVLVHKNRVIATGYNGTPSGEDNCCEDINGTTNPTVIHAEDNLLRYCKEYDIEPADCDLYVTLRPCINCAKLIKEAGIKAVYYSQVSGSSDGSRDYLWCHNIVCEAI